MIVGFAGEIGAGKNEAARALDGALVLEHSDPIYAMLGAMLDVPPLELKRRDAKEAPIEWIGTASVRSMAATLGTEWGRDLVDVDLWVKLLRRRVAAKLADGSRRFAVPGVRFKNEIDSIREMGGLVLWVHRPRPGETDRETLDRLLWRQEAAEDRPAGHRSEHSIGPWDCDEIVSNSGTIDDLHAQVTMAIVSARLAGPFPSES